MEHLVLPCTCQMEHVGSNCLVSSVCLVLTVLGFDIWGLLRPWEDRPKFRVTVVRMLQREMCGTPFPGGMKDFRLSIESDRGHL